MPLRSSKAHTLLKCLDIFVWSTGYRQYTLINGSLDEFYNNYISGRMNPPH